MDKNSTYTQLYDLYKGLLTVKQRNVFEQKFIYDLSYSEIAQNENISVQAVADFLTKAKHKLADIEEKVGFLSYIKENRK
ncbi:MAG: hypothetical protein LBL93_01965 [Ruminococcus sp.]|jgi:predicted DNA-binding protein YlxM (UPF0122 family)|nr:hypothetical protein [Ruminococcus sp.]